MKNPLSAIKVKGKNYCYGRETYNFYDKDGKVVSSTAAHVYLDPIRYREEKDKKYHIVKLVIKKLPL